MLNDLGGKRVLTLVALLVLNIVLAVYIFGYMTPNLQKAKRMLVGVKQETSEKREELAELKIQLGDLDNQKDDFNSIKNAGFFNRQDRREAEILLNKIQKSTNIVNATARVGAAKLTKDEDAARSGRLVMESPVSLELEALSDVDIFRYIYLLENHLPGHITIKDIDLNRERNPDGAVLRSIVNGDNPVVSRAAIEVIWRTMVTQEQTEEEL